MSDPKPRPHRIATYNIEWFNSLFDSRGRPKEDESWSSRYEITHRRQLDALGAVLRHVDPDALMVIEAPDDGPGRHTVDMLETFAARSGLRARKAVFGFANDTQQEIAALYDPDRLTLRHDPQGGGPAEAPRFDATFPADLTGDGRETPMAFNKPPLELAALTAGGTAFRMIGMHAKSKAPHGATTPEAVRRLAIENRRKQFAECRWVRGRVLNILAAHQPVMVMGDLNDGPGLDEYEQLFGRSGVEEVLGWNEPRATRLFDPHAKQALGQRNAAAPTTARFYNDTEKRYFTAILDYLMVSQDLRARRPRWRIWHPFDDQACYVDDELRKALLDASDHFPVSIDIALD